MYKTWKLNKEQYVSFIGQKFVEFSHRKHDWTYSIFLSFCQVDILNDIIYLIRAKGKTNLYIPLGNGIVFMMKNSNRPCIQHFSRHNRRYFLFHDQSWYRYINYVHPRLISVMKYDRRSKDCQCSLANEINISHKYTNAVSRAKTRRWQYCQESEQRQVLSRTAAHDMLEGGRSDRSLFQRRCHSNDRQASDSDSSFEDKNDSKMDIEVENEHDNGRD
jgi:hypothetical protein